MKAVRSLLDRARAAVDVDENERLLMEMVSRPSPTGDEAELARWLVEYMASCELDAEYQAIAEGQGNAIGRIRSTGDGPTLLLYGHIDTHLSGRDDEDAPATHSRLPAMSRPAAFRDGDRVFGLGAGNPKAYSACMVLAAAAVARAGIPLRGDLVVGLAAGGMPTNAPAGSGRMNIGQGVGAAFMLQQGLRPDFAVIGKPGHAVAWEEVGVCYFRVRVKGLFGYAGARHILDYSNPIVGAATVVSELERWCARYTVENTSGFVAPQAAMGAIRGGWPHKPSFIPAWTDVHLDVRVSPRVDPTEVREQLEAELADICVRHPELELELSMELAIPGTETAMDSWIVQSCIRAFEDVERRPHVPIEMTSGATDAEILRMWGIPTARFGMASSVRADSPTLEMDMDSVELPSMARFVDSLLYAVVDTCCRSWGEIE
jgi:acetylornithine deacetylase/succinyl-diaminopimelate desuccinylase-like protein